MIPTSAALDAALALFVSDYGPLGNATYVREFHADLALLRRLQHEASTSAAAMTELVRETERLGLYESPKVFNLDEERARRLREEAGMACHDDDPEAA